MGPFETQVSDTKLNLSEVKDSAYLSRRVKHNVRTRIEQLVDMVNTYSSKLGLGRKVKHSSDFYDDILQDIENLEKSLNNDG